MMEFIKMLSLALLQVGLAVLVSAVLLGILLYASYSEGLFGVLHKSWKSMKAGSHRVMFGPRAPSEWEVCSYHERVAELELDLYDEIRSAETERHINSCPRDHLGHTPGGEPSTPTPKLPDLTSYGVYVTPHEHEWQFNGQCSFCSARIKTS